MKCPKCGTDCDRDEVDVGVGVVTGPWGCSGCGWSDDPRYDLSEGQPRERDGGVIDPRGGFTPNRDHLEKMADAEDAAGSTSVGGMAADFGQPLPCPDCGAASAGSCNGDAIYCCGSDSRSRSASCQIAELKKENASLRLEAAAHCLKLHNVRYVLRKWDTGPSGIDRDTLLELSSLVIGDE